MLPYFITELPRTLWSAKRQVFCLQCLCPALATTRNIIFIWRLNSKFAIFSNLSTIFLIPHGKVSNLKETVMIVSRSPILNPRYSILDTRYSILDTRASILNPRFSIHSNIEVRVETVNLLLGGTESKLTSSRKELVSILVKGQRHYPIGQIKGFLQVDYTHNVKIRKLLVYTKEYHMK